MPRFFFEPDGVRPTAGESVLLQGEDARHIAKSLRMHAGEELTLCDGDGGDYRCEILLVGTDGVQVRVLEYARCRAEPAVHLRLYQALPKGDKLDWIVQKAVELGVIEIVPVLSDRCISRPDRKAMQKKRDRLQKIALEAAKQCGRGVIPQVLELERFSDAVCSMKDAQFAILLYEGATRPLSSLLQPGAQSIAMMVGSEGGFSPEEAALAEANGVAAASLGARILRCETAPLCALSAVLYACGEF